MTKRCMRIITSWSTTHQIPQTFQTHHWTSSTSNQLTEQPTCSTIYTCKSKQTNFLLKIYKTSTTKNWTPSRNVYLPASSLTSKYWMTGFAKATMTYQHMISRMSSSSKQITSCSAIRECQMKNSIKARTQGSTGVIHMCSEQSISRSCWGRRWENLEICFSRMIMKTKMKRSKSRMLEAEVKIILKYRAQSFCDHWWSKFCLWESRSRLSDILKIAVCISWRGRSLKGKRKVLDRSKIPLITKELIMRGSQDKMWEGS